MSLRPLAALLVLAGACSREPTQLVVAVDSDFAVPAELSRLDVRVEDPSGAPLAEHTFDLGDGAGRFRLPLSFGIAEPRAAEAVLVRVVGRGEGLEIERRARTRLLAGKSLLLPMFLARSCLVLTCGETETCTEDGCRPIDVDPEELRPVEPGDEVDAGVPDAGTRDAGSDGATDAEGPSDASPGDGADLDAGGRDGATDGGPDGAIDGGQDGASDGGQDAAIDGGRDAAIDAGDGGADGGGGDGGAPVPCTSDRECGPPQQICEQQRCVPGCQPGACGAASTCSAISGRCIGPGLPLGATCAADGDCAEGFCLRHPRGAVCAVGCSRSDDCPLGFGCALYQGTSSCLHASVIGRPSVLQAGETCDVANDRCQGECGQVSGICRAGCLRGLDCGGGICDFDRRADNSIAGSCNLLAVGPGPGEGCIQATSCTNAICVGFTCRATCCGQSDCGAGEACLYDANVGHRVCLPSAAPSGGPVGRACAMPSDCESEICADVSRARPETRCSSLCCRDEDCAPFGSLSRCRPRRAGDTVLTVCVID